MGVDVSRLSPKAQKQVFEKLLESNRRATGAIFDGEEGNLTSRKKVAQNGSKYGNKKVEVSGILFDSKKEARRWIELDAMQTVGQIKDLQRQVKFELIPNQKINGKVVERAVAYVADFTYYDKGGSYVVEDTKGYKTPEYRLKKKLMLWVHGIRISEV